MLKKVAGLTRPTPARRDAPFRGQGRRRIETGGVSSGAHGTTNKEHQVCARRRVVRRPGPVECLTDARTKLAIFFSILLGLHQHLNKLLRFGSSPVTCTEDLVADNPL